METENADNARTDLDLHSPCLLPAGGYWTTMDSVSTTTLPPLPLHPLEQMQTRPWASIIARNSKTTQFACMLPLTPTARQQWMNVTVMCEYKRGHVHMCMTTWEAPCFGPALIGVPRANESLGDGLFQSCPLISTHWKSHSEYIEA